LRGNIYLSAILALIPAIAFVFMIDAVQKKKAQGEASFPEIFLIVLHSLLSVAVFLMFFHGISIEFLRKDVIKQAAYDKLATIDKLFEAYEDEIEKRLNKFETDVDIRFSAYELVKSNTNKKNLDDLIGDGTLDFTKPKKDIKAQLKNAILAKQNVIRKGWDLSKAKNNWDQDKNDKKIVVDNWKRMNISYVYYDIDNSYQKSYAAALVQMPDFSYTSLIKRQDIALDKPISAMAISPLLNTLLLLLFYVFAQILIFLPYVMEKRPKEILITPNNGSKNYKQSGGFN